VAAADNPRIDELRRRVEKDPSSVAFAQLAEEHRRAGQPHEAIRICRAGLVRHPRYISARVTLGRALIDVGQLDAAQAELEQARRAAPENLAAVRSLADIHQRRGLQSVDLGPWDAAVLDIPLHELIPDSASPDAAYQFLVTTPEHFPDPESRVPDRSRSLLHLESWLAAILADRASRHM
jgi:hypothetical protein